MRFEDIDNIWDVDFGKLSRADHGKVFFERSKQIIAEVLADKGLQKQAVRGSKFSRSYLTSRIGSGPAVTTQNPNIKELLRDADHALSGADKANQSEQVVPGQQSSEVIELKATIDALRRRLTLREAENADLRAKLKATGWLDLEGGERGVLPW